MNFITILHTHSMLLLKLGSFLLWCVTFDVFMCDSPNPSFPTFRATGLCRVLYSVVGAFRTHLSCFS